MADYQSFLINLTQNLNTLRQREAKYGGNAPLELLNQIEDHQKAMALTEQALNGELSQAEWEEALKPLLLSANNGQAINLQAETYIAGDVRGDFVKSDKVEGDKVFGNKIITHIYEAPPPPLPPAEAKERHDLRILLGKVKQFWIEGVLEKSVHAMALIDLGKETQLEAVAHAWEQVLELPDQSRQTLPPDKKISQIFDEMNRALLILGAPGSGKTITLLQLTRDLIHQAEQDESFSQPVPVVFNLSTWSKGQELIDWLTAELSAKYQIPQRIGRPWLENNRLLPLLDGLDEVRLADRDDCVKAINQFGMEFGLSGLVVCSRLEEYISLPVRLKLNGAIRLQPLTLEQVYDYLEAAGAKLNVLRTALQVDNDLQTLAQSPLMLGILILAYQDIPVESLMGQAHPTLEARRKHLLDTYIERMFRRKGRTGHPYPDEQTKGQLAWLAQQMSRHNQAIFLIEQLQPSWLASRRWSWVYALSSRLIGMLIAGQMWGLLMGVSAARLLKVNNTLMPGLEGWLIFGVVFGLIGGLFWGLIDGVRFQRSGQYSILQRSPTRWQQVLNVGVVGLILGLVAGLISGLFAGLWFGLWSVMLGMLLTGLFVGLRGSRQSLTQDIQTVEALRWSWQRGLKSVPFGFIGGAIFGLSAGLIFELHQELLDSLQRGLVAELIGERLFVLGVGLFYGLYGAIVSAMFGGLRSQIVKTKTVPNQGIRLSLRNALLAGPVFGLIIGLVGGLLLGLLFGVRNGVDVGLAWGLLMGTLAFAWYGGLDVIQHYTLRLILRFQGRIPRHYAHFLDYAAERIFLQKVGGGYIFIHRLLLEHFASLEPKK
ncbi:MAG: hypothetical protein BroJett011_79160 [Chloroflexota bacterium]|nr:MAG: hypothetical protein BroJett011_79160 [Chloroflexota bacterium]